MTSFTICTELAFSYVNHRGDYFINRHVRALKIYYGSTEWHPEPQWLIRAWDFDKKEMRDFAMKDMTEVKVVAL